MSDQQTFETLCEARRHAGRLVNALVRLGESRSALKRVHQVHANLKGRMAEATPRPSEQAVRP
jgi:hypothetical protein